MDDDLMAFAVELAQGAGSLALSHLRDRGSLAVERKGVLDLVTRADREVEQFVRTGVRQRYPDDGFFGEEGARKLVSRGRTWVVDPIDGTLNYVRGHDAWAVSIGILEDGSSRFGVIHAPARGETFRGGEGHGALLNGAPLPAAPAEAPQDGVIAVGLAPAVPLDDQLSLLRHLAEECGMSFRRNGSATVSLMMLAQRQVDGFIGLGVSSWDVAAAEAITRTLGYRSTVAWERTPLDAKLYFACAPAGVFERLTSWGRFGLAPGS